MRAAGRALLLFARHSHPPAPSDDYTKTIQVGPNIQFIYRINVCGNTVVKCQNQEAPATEVRGEHSPPRVPPACGTLGGP